ncbi:hypothetical protein ACJRO7_021369 [Eucalyptus globulus]|uniref:DUF7745 domain-containing protein n=1 Tax=Eucalyptus globulus TaxID=34317 RepID=A0ABD3KJV9_EUCGL
MGKSDIRFVPAPKAELKSWWDRLGHEGQSYVESRLGRLVPLLDVDVQSGVMQALAHFWSPQTSTFIFGKHELTPTLEEYNIAIGKPLELELINPPIGLEPESILSDFLKMDKNLIKRVLKDNCLACPFSFLDQIFASANTLLKSRIFLLAFFGLVIFPLRKGAINPSIAWVVKQVCARISFVNTILAETFLSLTRFKEDEDKTFRAPIELLQIWFFSHMSKINIRMNIINVTDVHHPIEVFKNHQDRTPNLSYSKWVKLLKNPNTKIFLWHAKWFKVSKARLSHGNDEPIPLLGITGVTSYYPLRVARQYRVVQDLPPPLKLGLFQARFTAKDGDHKKELRCIEQAWIACRAQKLSLPEDELEGKEKTYYATARYIRQHKIPTEYLPKVPDVTEKPTRQAELNHHKRKIEELEEQAKKDAKEKRQLRRALASHMFIDQAK